MSLFILGKDDTLTVASRSPVIKAHERATVSEAIETLSDIQQTRVRILSNAETEAETIRAEAYKKGLANGEAAAAQAKTAALLEMEQKLAAATRTANQQAKDMALQMVQSIIGTFKTDEVTAAIASQAVSKIEDGSPLTVYVAPKNLKATEKQIKGLAYACVVEADESLGPLDCRVSNAFGEVDASLDSQLDVLRSLLGDEDEQT